MRSEERVAVKISTALDIMDKVSVSFMLTAIALSMAVLTDTFLIALVVNARA